MAFQSGGFQPADAAPDDRFNSTIVLVELSEHFTAFAADDDLGEAVIAAIATFLAIGTGFDHSPADQLFLKLYVINDEAIYRYPKGVCDDISNK